MAKKTKKTTSYDLEKEVMLALVIRRPLRNRLERIIPEGETMRSFVTALIEKAVHDAANSQTNEQLKPVTARLRAELAAGGEQPKEETPELTMANTDDEFVARQEALRKEHKEEGFKILNLGTAKE